MFEGEIAQIDLLARMVEMWREQFTGAIRFENDGVIKIVYFKGGDVLSASTNDRADSVDEILMRAGKVSKEHVKQALAKRKENETLGDALLNLGFITRKELAWARRIQVINVIRSVDDWEGGSFTIVADYLPKRDEGTQYPLPQILVEMIVTDADRQKFEKALESGSVVFEKTGGWEDIFRKIGLNEDAEAIMGQVDGVRSASEVANASHQETFNAFKLMHALSLLGILRRKEAAVPIVPSSFDTAGVDDAADAWDSPAAPSIPATDSSLTQFTLDDDLPAPSLSIPAAEPSFSSSSFSDSSFSDSALSDSALSSFSPSTPSFSEPPEPVSPAPAPSWDPPPPRGSSPILTPEPPPAVPADEGFGFDMAQVEAARKTFSQQIPTPGVKPIPSPRATSSEGTMTRSRKAAVSLPPKRSSRLPLLIGLMLFFIAAAGGYFGYNWWTSRDAAPAPVVTATTATVPPPATTTAPETVTIVPADTAGQQTASAAPLPVVLAPVPAPVTQTATPRPTPQPVTGGDVKARYDAMAREFAANPVGNYTIQFAIVCDPSNVTKALRSSAADRVWFIPISVKDRSCYRLFWGGFQSREQADAALPTIPGELRESKPSVVTVPR